MTGQNIGAGKQDRAAETNHLARAMLVIPSGIRLLTLMAARPIASIFTNDPAVVAESASFRRYAALSFGLMGVMRACTGGFRGAGKTMIVAVVSVVTLGLVRLPVAWLGASVIGSTGLWIAFPISNAVVAVVAYLWFERGTWRTSDLTDANSGADAPSPDTASSDDRDR